MTRRRTLAPAPSLALLMALTLVALVCSSSCGPDEKLLRKPVYPVSGQVFLRGKPAAGPLVIFRPARDAEDMTYFPTGYPRGKVAKDGTFRLSTYGAFDGAPAGDYEVAVVWGSDGAEDDPRRAPYMNPKTSGLRAEVKEGPNELPPFHLK